MSGLTAGRGHIEDGDLIELLKEGADEEREFAARQLFSRHYAHLVSTISRSGDSEIGADAQEAAADTLLKFFLSPGRYDPKAGALRTFLTVVARHKLSDLQRRRRGVGRVPLSQIPELDDAVTHYAERPDREHFDGLLRREIGQLPEATRTTLTLHLQGLTALEIAERLCCQLGLVRTRLCRARAALRARLEQQ